VLGHGSAAAPPNFASFTITEHLVTPSHLITHFITNQAWQIIDRSRKQPRPILQDQVLGYDQDQDRKIPVKSVLEAKAAVSRTTFPSTTKSTAKLLYN